MRECSASETPEQRGKRLRAQYREEQITVIMLHIGQVKSQHLQSDLLLQPTLHTHCLTGILSCNKSRPLPLHFAHCTISVIMCLFVSSPDLVLFCCHQCTFTQHFFMHTCIHATCTPSLTCTHSFTLPRLWTTFSLTSLWCGLGTSVMPTVENAFVFRSVFIFVIVLYAKFLYTLL